MVWNGWKGARLHWYESCCRVLKKGRRSGSRIAFGIMPAHEYLSDREAAAILTYIRLSWGNDASGIRFEKGGNIRAMYESYNREWTPAELRRHQGGED